MESVIEKFMQKPTKLVSEIGLFIRDITPHLMSLNEQLDNPEFVRRHPTLLGLIAKCLEALMEIVLKQYKAYNDYHNMTSTGPLNCIMGVFMIMQYFAVLIEDRIDNSLKPWQIRTSAKEMLYIVKSKMCISDKPIKSYNLDDMTMALYVASVRWYRLDWQCHEEIERYLLGLFHRLCLLSVCVDEEINNIVSGKDGVIRDEREIENEVHRINVIRSRSSMQLFRMLYLLRFIKNIHKVIVPTDKDDEVWRQVEHLRRYSADLIKILSKTREAKTEIYSVFPKLLQLHGDVENFINKRGLENARPNSLLMTVRPEAQQSMTLLHQFVILSNVQTMMNDDDPDHFNKYTRYECIYMLILKTYMINMALKDTKTDKKSDIDFFRDFVVHEMDIPHFLDRIMSTHEPVVLQLFGKLHVYFDKKLYICHCVEMAVIMWARLILHDLGGRIGTSDISKPLKNLLGILSAEDQQLVSDMASTFSAINIVGKGKIVID